MGYRHQHKPLTTAAGGVPSDLFDGFDGAYLNRAVWPLMLSGQATNVAYAFAPQAGVEWNGEVAVNTFGDPNG